MVTVIKRTRVKILYRSFIFINILFGFKYNEYDQYVLAEMIIVNKYVQLLSSNIYVLHYIAYYLHSSHKML